MAGEVRNHRNFRETYADGRHLPVEVADEVIARSTALLEFLSSEKTTTHPSVRAITSAIEIALTQLRAEKMADEIMARGGGEDEMDVWERNGIRAKEQG